MPFLAVDKFLMGFLSHTHKNNKNRETVSTEMHKVQEQENNAAVTKF